MPRGRAPEVSELVRFPGHAKTLRKLAEQGPRAYYEGEIAEQIAAFAREGGGAMTADDLRNYRADWVEPIGKDYRGYTVHEIPPNGQGIAALIALGILEKFDVEYARRRQHRVAAFADRSHEARIRRCLPLRGRPAFDGGHARADARRRLPDVRAPS